MEMSELTRRLKAERGVRKACERWLRVELRSRVRGRVPGRRCCALRARLRAARAMWMDVLHA